MPTITQDLAAIPSFSNVAALDLMAASRCWVQRSIDPGQTLWVEGERANGLALLVEGELAVERQGKQVGMLLAGEVLGESAAFVRHHIRTVTLRAVLPCRLLIISGGNLEALRAAKSGVYDALVELGHHGLVRRIRAANLRVARSSNGSEAAPARPQRSGLARLWSSLRPGLPTTACPAIDSLLRSLPGLHSADAHAISAIARGFTPTPLAAGSVLFLEGEPGGAAWLLAEGRVDVLKNVRGGQAERLATLGPGALVGVNALIERGARTASCVLATPSWLYRMDGPAGYKHLRGADRLLWRESLLGSLALQMRSADNAIEARGVRPGRPGGEAAIPEGASAARAARGGGMAGSGSKSEPPANTEARGVRPGRPGGEAAIPEGGTRAHAVDLPARFGAPLGEDGARFAELLHASGWVGALDGFDLAAVETIEPEDDAPNARRRVPARG